MCVGCMFGVKRWSLDYDFMTLCIGSIGEATIFVSSYTAVNRVHNRLGKVATVPATSNPHVFGYVLSQAARGGEAGLPAFSSLGVWCWRFLTQQMVPVPSTACYINMLPFSFCAHTMQRLPPHFRCFSSAGYHPRRTVYKTEHPPEKPGPIWCSEHSLPSWATLSTDICRYPLGVACNPTTR